MKRLWGAAVLASGLLAADAAWTAEQTMTLAIENMTCASCPYIVKRSLAAIPGVRNAQASFETKSATVTFDDEKTNVAALIDATTKAGYPSQPLK